MYNKQKRFFFFFFQKFAFKISFTDAHHKYMDAVKLHLAWLKSVNNSYERGYDVIVAYRYALNEMKEILVKNMLKNDMHLMITAMLLLCHVCMTYTPRWIDNQRYIYIYIELPFILIF